MTLATMPMEIPSHQEAAPVTSGLRLAYLTTEYPKVSHTFIRREILELERRGHSILRLAIRSSGGAVAGEADQLEARQTLHFMSQPKWKWLAAVVWTKLTRPLKWVAALGMTLAMSRASDRSMLRHLAYMVEAAFFLRVLRRRGINHLHVHFSTNAATVARLIRRLGGPTYSMTVHGPSEFDSPRGFSLREKVIDASFVVAISDYCAAQIRRWAPYEHWHKIHVVHCTVGERFFEQARPIDPPANTLVCVGRLTAAKAQLLLIDAVKRLLDEGLNLELVLAGDGEMRPEIEHRIKRYGLQSSIEITGWIDEAAVRRHLLSARALVQPSFAEGLPVVIMEAMALGRPVISTWVAGIPELVHPGENGWLIPPANVDALVNALREVLAAPVERLNAMGQAGRRLVYERHFTQTEVAKLEAMFDRYVSADHS